MAGETVKTKAIVIDIRPWSRTSHITTWLTPEHGPVATLVKGAVRPKSRFLGQYDLFYTCELVYYVRAKGELHAIREASPIDMRDYIRGDYRATALASYAAYLVGEHCPHGGGDADRWFRFLERWLDHLAESPADATSIVGLECEFLALAGLSPDFSGADFSASSIPFAIDLGHVGEGGRTVRISGATARALAGGDGDAGAGDIASVVRFLGMFMRYHLDLPPEIRRNTLLLLANKNRK